jgi:hypothetical protein
MTYGRTGIVTATTVPIRNDSESKRHAVPFLNIFTEAAAPAGSLGVTESSLVSP